MVIASFLTNLLVDGLGEDSDAADLDVLLDQLLLADGGFFPFCDSYPNIRFFLCYTNVRLRPSWFARFRPTIIRSLDTIMKTKPKNLQMIDDFNGHLEKDGIHFSILCGISYVQFIVDQALELIKQPVPEESIG